MAKSKTDLPSVDGKENAPPTTKDMPQLTSGQEIEGYLPRHVDVRMNRTQAAKFRKLQRQLEDNGECLIDGTQVNNRRRVVLWLIENY